MKRLIAYCLILLLCACGSQPQAQANGIVIEQAWIRLPVISTQASVAYMQISNRNQQDDYLLEVHSAAYDPIEMHTVSYEDGRMLMRPVDTLRIPAGGQARFETAGDHLMLFPVDSDTLQAGQQVQLSLVFQNAGELNLSLDLRRE